MIRSRLTIIVLCLALLPTARCLGAPDDTTPDEGTLVTIWPLVDYRESPADRFSNLAVLGPLFKRQTTRDGSDVAIRPLFYRATDASSEATASDYLYPLASSESTPAASRAPADCGGAW